MKWDAVKLCDPDRIPPQVYALYEIVADAIWLCGAQIAFALRSVAEGIGDTNTVSYLDNLPDKLSRIEPDEAAESFERDKASEAAGRSWPAPPLGTPEKIPLQALLPMHPSHGLRPDSVSMLSDGAKIFESILSGKRPAGRFFRDDEMAVLAFAWQRYSVARGAQQAFEEERRILGDEFNLDGLRGREVPYLLTSEIAGLVSGWASETCISSAAAAVSTSIRSAYWLWLEDDDRAMGVLRTTLEQTARLRVWRRRPDKARKLEASERTTPRDWLESAGWRRLEALNRALGEMAHTRVGSRWHGARALLGQLQPALSTETSMYTARGFCLDTVISLAGRELVLATQAFSPAVAKAFASTLRLPAEVNDQGDAEVEEFMNRAWAQRTTSLGPPTFTGPGRLWAVSRRPPNSPQ
jgi:hypothetical protein